MLKNNDFLKIEQKLERRNQMIDISETDKFLHIPARLLDCVFFDGKCARKIDSFPNNAEIELLLQNFTISLDYWRNEMIINFLERAFGKNYYGADSIIKSYYYMNPPSEEDMRFDAKSIIGLSFNNGKIHLIGEQTKLNIIEADWFFLMKNRFDCSKKCIRYKKFARIKSFDIPFLLRPFVEFDGKKIIKKCFFPKALNKMYDAYICKLKTLFTLYECDFWERMFRFRWDRPYRKY